LSRRSFTTSALSSWSTESALSPTWPSLWVAEISQRLRHDRELAFYIDFIPTEQYSSADAARAFEDAAWILRLAEEAITRGRRP
jgi:hypothetical protein